MSQESNRRSVPDALEPFVTAAKFLAFLTLSLSAILVPILIVGATGDLLGPWHLLWALPLGALWFVLAGGLVLVVVDSY